MHNVEMITGEGFTSIIRGNYDQNNNNENSINVYLHCKETQFLKVSESNCTHDKIHTESAYKALVYSKKKEDANY